MTIFTDGPRLPPERGIHEYESGLGEVLSTTAVEALKSGPASLLYGTLELGEAQGHFGPPSVLPGEEPPANVPMADAKAQVQSIGLEKHLHLPEQETIKKPALDIMIDRAKARREREATLARGPGGFIPGALSVGTSFLVGAVDPLNVAAAFIPVVGEMRYAKMLADVGESALGRFAVRAGTGAVTGAAFTAGMQPLEWYAHTQEGQDFGMSEALRNIIYGAGTFSLLHTVGGSASDVYRGYRRQAKYPFAEGEPFGPKPIEAPTAAGMGPEGVAPETPISAPEHVMTAAAARKAVFDDVEARLREAGMSPEQAEVNAEIVAARYATRASRLEGEGGDAFQLYRGEGIEIRGPGGEDIPGRGFEQRRPAEPDLFAQREAEGQLGLPGTERIGQGEQAQRQADQPLKPAVAQKPMDEGLFSDQAKQKSFFQSMPQAPVFYSAVERAVTEAKQEKASPDQWLGMLKNRPGVKPEEMEWLGLESWLKEQRGSVSKQELADYIRANAIEVKEVTKGGPPPDTHAAARAINRELMNKYGDLATAFERWTPEEQARFDAIHASASGEAGPADTKFFSYTLPGGENYREVLLTLPQPDRKMTFDEWRGQNGREDSAEARRDFSQWLAWNPEKITRGGYRSSHWDEPNVLAHIRHNDRIIDGKKALFIEEIQSDWHQAGKRHRYQEELPQSYEIVVKETGEVLDAHLSRADAEALAHDNPNWQIREGQGPVTRFEDTVGGQRVPDAPFKTTWPELALKRMIRYAAENGYDMVAWTPGRVQAERYDLSKQVDAVRAVKRPSDGAYVLAARLKEHTAFTALNDGAAVPVENLADYIGKDLADKIVKGGDGQQIYTGIDLKVGGEGMSGFYDKILPAAANKLTKKFGGKVERKQIDTEPTEFEGFRLHGEVVELTPEVIRVHGIDDGRRFAIIDEEGVIDQRFASRAEADASLTAKHETVTKGAEVHSLDITPSLREAATNEGFPLFQKDAAGDPRGRITLTGEIDALAEDMGKVAELMGRRATLMEKVAESGSTARELAEIERLGREIETLQGEPAGQIKMAHNRAIIDLFSRADKSTFMHEMGHLWLEELKRDAARSAEGSQLRTDMEVVLAWLKADKPGEIGTAEHEQWARGFEKYLAEGNAPSSALRRAFDRFKEWLATIYRSLADINSPINQDIRAVMDRMLASEEELRGKPTPIEIIADLPPRAKEDTMRAATVALTKGDAVQAGEIITAGAKADPRIAEAVEGPARTAAPLSETIPESEIVTKAVTGAKRGRAAADPDTWSLLEFLASRGGIAADDPLAGDVRALLGKDNKFIPGFGPLIRKGGRRLDEQREAAVEAGYIFDIGFIEAGRQSETTINTLLERMDQELRGQKVYKEGHVPKPTEQQQEQHLAAIEKEVDGQWRDEDVGEVSPELRKRVIEMFEKEGESDAVRALERAALEAEEAYDPAADRRRLAVADIPGWDVPADAGAAPVDRGPTAGGPERRQAPVLREAAREAGPGDREQADATWHELARERPPEYDPDVVAASKAAEALPEPASMEPSKRLSAALESEAQSGEIYKAMEPYLPEEYRTKIGNELAILEQQGKDAEQVLRQGAACLAAAGVGAAV